jgi:hypothetical protein
MKASIPKILAAAQRVCQCSSRSISASHIHQGLMLYQYCKEARDKQKRKPIIAPEKKFR